MPVQIIQPGTHIDFLGSWRICVAFSLALIAAGLVGVATRGVQLGIDFAVDQALGFWIHANFMNTIGRSNGHTR